MRVVFSLCLSLLLFNASAQKKKVREDYFQQEVQYSIDVKLDDENHTLTGFERLVYINRSPQTLSQLYFHLWPNAYRNNETALAKQLLENGETAMHFANPQGELGFIDSLQFIVNKDTIRWEYDSTHMDIVVLHLNKLLKPGDTAIITT
ncbi:MAG TPA: hypothetical protein PK610_12680, partial [Flavobacteriales bacterium]|nr:hypothetical protein [Flavobacteriales bacterium]